MFKKKNWKQNKHYSESQKRRRETQTELNRFPLSSDWFPNLNPPSHGIDPIWIGDSSTPQNLFTTAMDPAMTPLGKMLLGEITPVVMVISTPAVEETCLKNGFSFLQMLTPFCSFNNIDGISQLVFVNRGFWFVTRDLWFGLFDSFSASEDREWSALSHS